MFIINYAPYSFGEKQENSQLVNELKNILEIVEQKNSLNAVDIQKMNLRELKLLKRGLESRVMNLKIELKDIKMGTPYVQIPIIAVLIGVEVFLIHAKAHNDLSWRFFNISQIPLVVAAGATILIPIEMFNNIQERLQDIEFLILSLNDEINSREATIEE